MLQRERLERNLRLIPLHESLAGAHVWLPVFVLFTRARFDLDGALVLASLYYLFVVVLEVPSGWMSDRLGRVLTLRIAALGFVGAQLCFALGDDAFGVVMLGQFLLAVGFASLSGTDVAFHYDTLEALDLAHEYTHRQARVKARGYLVVAASALLGGSLGLIDVRLAFVASGIASIGQFAVAARLTEPPHHREAAPFVAQLRICAASLRDRWLGWIFFYGVLMVTLEHVAFSVMQPWLTEVLDRPADDLGSTPLLAGIVYAVTAVLGAGAARGSARLERRVGTVAALVALGALSAVIVTSMAMWVHAAVLVVASMRSVQGAAAPVLIVGAIAPLTAQRQRATLLSMNSLAGRLGYGLVLLTVSSRADDDVRGVLAALAIVAWAMVAVLGATGWAVRRGEAAPATA